MKRNLLYGGALLVASAGLCAVFTPGGAAYTKRFQTHLLAEPNVLAKRVAVLGYGQKLTIDRIDGSWLAVRDAQRSGWIFAANLAEEKPEEPERERVAVGASQTTAATAARPLTKTSEDYSQRRGLAQAATDLRWLEEQRTKITPEVVERYLHEQKKGEYQ